MGENDVAYCLGDVCDRGPDGIKIMQEMLEDKRIIYLQGNHEQMLLDSVNLDIVDQYDEKIIKYNGGWKTLQDFKALPHDQQEDLKKKISELPIVCIWFNQEQTKRVFLCHAGCHGSMLHTWDDRKHFHKYVWDRGHITETDWNELFFPNVYIVHGHTPVQTINPEHGAKILRYCNEHKIDIDLGTPSSNRVALLDLDTFEPIYFDDIDNN